MENKMPNLNNIFKSEERNISLALQRYSTVGKDSYKLLCESAYKDFSDKEVVRSVAQIFKNKVEGKCFAWLVGYREPAEHSMVS